MIEKPTWLPNIISTNGQWEEVIRKLYGIFVADFVNGRPKYMGLPVWWDRRKIDGDAHEEGFWHLVTRDNQGERLLDPRRAERLPWCAPTLQHHDDTTVKTWKYREGKGKVRNYVWLEDWDYVIILELKKQRLGEIAFLVTAYHVDGDAIRRSLRRKYENKVP